MNLNSQSLQLCLWYTSIESWVELLLKQEVAAFVARPIDYDSINKRAKLSKLAIVYFVR